MSQQWLVEFKGGTGYTFDSYREAQLCAAEIVLERATVEMDTNPEAKVVLDQLAHGSIGEAISLWNDIWNNPVVMRTVEKGRDLEAEGSLRERALAAVHRPPPVPKVSLMSAIKHAEHRAEVAPDSQSSQEYAQLAEWLNDLNLLHKEVRDWAQYVHDWARPARTPDSHEEALLEVLQELKGHYDDE